MKIKTVEAVQNLLWSIVGLSLILSYFLNMDILWMIAVIALGLIFVVRAKFWRCPYCRKYIGREKGKYCKNCGKEIK